MAAPAGSLKRKRGQHPAADDSLPTGVTKGMGVAGASAFNDHTYDIGGDKARAAARVKRGVSNVAGAGAGAGAAAAGGSSGSGGGGGGPPAGLGRNDSIGRGESRGESAGTGNGDLHMWGQHIPMPHVGRDHSLAPPGVGATGSLGGLGLRSESLGKGDSWGSVARHVGEGMSPPMVGREHSLGLGLSGLSRDMSLGSLDLPPLSRGPSQMDPGAGAGASGGAGNNSGGVGASEQHNHHQQQG